MFQKIAHHDEYLNGHLFKMILLTEMLVNDNLLIVNF